MQLLLTTRKLLIHLIVRNYGQACVRWGARISEFFDCSLAVKQGCLFRPLIFFLSPYPRLLILSDKMVDTAFNCSQDLKKYFYCYLQTTLCQFPLHRQVCKTRSVISRKFLTSLGLTVNLDKSNDFQKGGHIASGEKWFYNGSKLEIVNSYKYLGYTLTTK